MRRQRCRDSNALSGHALSESSGFRIRHGGGRHNGRGSVTILRHRVITYTHRTGSTHSGSRRRRYQVSFSYAPPKRNVRLLLAALHLQYSPRSRARCKLPASANVKSLHLRRPKPGLPAPALACCTRAVFSPIFGRVSISQPLTSPSLCSFAPATLSIATFISLHTDTRPRARIPQLSALCCLPTLRIGQPTL